MDRAKRKGLIIRSPESERPPERLNGVPARLASEPVSRFRPFEDRWELGFLRLPRQARGRPLSWVVDSIGIYFDATAPSELELLLEEGGWETEAILLEAEAGLSALRRSGLSLDNDGSRADLGAILGAQVQGGGKPRDVVVVVDQPLTDHTLGFALAGPGRFNAMLRDALAENPGSRIVVIMDPAAPAARLAGHLLQQALPEDVTAVAEPVTSRSVVEQAARIYTICAHVGFEAAMAGRPVSCFGLPFYSGWGFTDDRLVANRRTRRRSVQEVFAAAYLQYSRYYDPGTGRKIGFADALAILEHEVRAADEQEPATALGGSRGPGQFGPSEDGPYHLGLSHVWSALRRRFRPRL